MINQIESKINAPGINKYEVLLRSKGVTHMTLVMYAKDRETIAEQLGSRVITMGDVVVMMGDKIDEIAVIESGKNE